MKYGLPFLGFMSSKERHLVPPTHITGDSHDLDYSANDGSFTRSKGTDVAQTGVLEETLLSKLARRIIEFKSPALSDSQPTYGTLYRNTSFGGVFAFRNSGTAATPAGSNETIGKDFSATQYPANFKCIPMVGLGFGYTRLKTAPERAVLAAGSDNCIEVGDDMLFPSRDGVPHLWNKDFNGSTTTGSRNFRLFPAGAIPPLRPPTVVTASYVDGDGPFEQSKWFFLSAVFESNDGSMSQPFVPRPFGTLNLPNGLGLNQIPIGPNNKSTIGISVPRGPYNCRRVHVLATPLAESAEEAKITDLQVWFSVDNESTGNTILMNDFNLYEDSRIVRFDRIWMPPASFAWTGDQRVWCGNVNVPRWGIILAPYIDASDESTGGTAYEYKVESGTLTLYKVGSGNHTVSLSSTKSLQKVVDQINSSTSASGGGQWMAQLVPGTDPFFDSNTYTLYSTGNDTGDSTPGQIRAFNNAYPGVMWVSQGTLAPELERTVYFTEGGPGVPGMSPRSWKAGNYRTGSAELGGFIAGGEAKYGQVVAFAKGIMAIRNTKDSRSGDDADYYLYPINSRRGCISADGFVRGDGWCGYPTEDGFVVCDGDREVIISKDVYDPAKQTGEWRDEITACLSYAKSRTASSLSGYPMFRAMVSRGTLWVTYRFGAGAEVANSRIFYDFSNGESSNGIEQMLRPDGTPWGWSAPRRFTPDEGVSLGAMGCVSKSTGDEFYAANDLSTYTTGRTEKFQTGYFDLGAVLDLSCTTNTDDGTQNILETSDSFSRIAVGATISKTGVPGGTTVQSKVDDQHLIMSANATVASTSTATFTGLEIEPEGKCSTTIYERRARLKKATPWYHKNSDGMDMTVSRDIARLSKDGLALDAASGTVPVVRKLKKIPTRLQSLSECHELGFTDDGSGFEYPKFWGIETEVEVTNSTL